MTEYIIIVALVSVAAIGVYQYFGQVLRAQTAAIAKVNKAKDNYIKKNNKVRQSEKEVTSQVNKLCKELSDVGTTIGGEAGEIISLIGDIGSL